MPTVYKYIDQGGSNYWNRGFESNMPISVYLCFSAFSAVLWMSCKELISYTKSLNIARKEETPPPQKGGVGKGRGGGEGWAIGALSAIQTRKEMSNKC
jgi:hypothetical protein